METDAANPINTFKQPEPGASCEQRKGCLFYFRFRRRSNEVFSANKIKGAKLSPSIERVLFAKSHAIIFKGMVILFVFCFGVFNNVDNNYEAYERDHS